MSSPWPGAVSRVPRRKWGARHSGAPVSCAGEGAAPVSTHRCALQAKEERLAEEKAKKKAAAKKMEEVEARRKQEEEARRLRWLQQVNAGHGRLEVEQGGVAPVLGRPAGHILFCGRSWWSLLL